KGESLTGLAGIGPYLERIVRGWIDDPPKTLDPPALRSGFLTLAEARRILATRPDWAGRYRGDLQMHSNWSDGAGTIRDLAEAACARGYQYVGITDHSKGLKIAGGIDENELLEQTREIEAIN